MVSLRRLEAKRRARMAGATRSRVAVVDNPMGAFEVLPHEVILHILAALAASADRPADIFNALLVCRMFGNLVMTPQVLRAASAACVSVLPRRWCAAADRFIRFCADLGNADANFFLGMIQFYCFEQQHLGWSRMMAAAGSGHAHAAFAAAVVYYNRTFIDFEDGDPLTAAHLFALAACHGHMGALRDLAFCIGNGTGGVREDADAGRRLMFTANMQEFAATYRTDAELVVAYAHVRRSPRCLTSELGCFTTVPTAPPHPANRFLCEWFAAHPSPFQAARLLLMCSSPTCGRPETRPLEYRRCHVCGIARYCSRTCQSLHWRTGHTRECVPVHQWLMEAINNQAALHVGANAAAVPAAVNNNVTDDDSDLGGGAGAGDGAPPTPFPAPAPK